MRAFAILLCGLLLVGGCIRCINPVLKDDQVGEYPQLAGKWMSTDKLRVTVSGEGRSLHVTLTNAEGETGEYALRVGSFGGLTVAEFRPAELAKDARQTMQVEAMIRPYYFFVITAMEPEVRIRTLKSDALEKHLKDAGLKMAGSDDNEVLLATTDQLQEAIIKLWPSADAWTDEVIFTRPAADASN